MEAEAVLEVSPPGANYQLAAPHPGNNCGDIITSTQLLPGWRERAGLKEATEWPVCSGAAHWPAMPVFFSAVFKGKASL